MSPMYHRLEVYVLDFENWGIKEISHMISNMDNCYVRVGEHQTTVIPEWTDDHELNKTKCTLETRRKYFDIKQVCSYVDIPLRPKTELEVENEKLKKENTELRNKLLRILNTYTKEFGEI